MLRVATCSAHSKSISGVHREKGPIVFSWWIDMIGRGGYFVWSSLSVGCEPLITDGLSTAIGSNLYAVWEETPRRVGR